MLLGKANAADHPKEKGSSAHKKEEINAKTAIGGASKENAAKKPVQAVSAPNALHIAFSCPEASAVSLSFEKPSKDMTVSHKNSANEEITFKGKKKTNLLKTNR